MRVVQPRAPAAAGVRPPPPPERARPPAAHTRSTSRSPRARGGSIRRAHVSRHARKDMDIRLAGGRVGFGLRSARAEDS